MQALEINKDQLYLSNALQALIQFQNKLDELRTEFLEHYGLRWGFGNPKVVCANREKPYQQKT